MMVLAPIQTAELKDVVTALEKISVNLTTLTSKVDEAVVALKAQPANETQLLAIATLIDQQTQKLIAALTSPTP